MKIDKIIKLRGKIVHTVKAQDKMKKKQNSKKFRTKNLTVPLKTEQLESIIISY